MAKYTEISEKERLLGEILRSVRSQIVEKGGLKGGERETKEEVVINQ